MTKAPRKPQDELDDINATDARMNENTPGFLAKSGIVAETDKAQELAAKIAPPGAKLSRMSNYLPSDTVIEHTEFGINQIKLEKSFSGGVIIKSGYSALSNVFYYRQVEK